MPERQADRVLPARPRLAENVAVHPPRDDGGQWLIERPGPKFFRVGADVATLARLLTGEHDRRELLTLLDDRWNDEGLTKALSQFQQMRLLDDGRSPRAAKRRLSISPPLTIQLSLLDPTALLRRMLPLIELLSRPRALVAVGALALGGVVALAASAGEVLDALGRPIGAEAFLYFLLVVFVSTAIHELAHAAVLVRYGARPRRMGVMLFYLVPAFFCDVSDGWLLPHNRQRVRVALAGVVAQAACAGLVALATLAVDDPATRQVMLLTSASLYLAGLVNGIPFVKLDGYLALMAWLDVPKLRTKAIDDARSFLASVLFGSRRERRLPQLRWAVPYGICCMAFPLYLVGVVAFAMWSRLLVNTGYVGAMLALIFLSVLLTMLYQGVDRLIRQALSAGARVLRVAAVGLGAVVVLGVVLTEVQVSEKVTGAYQVTDGGGVLLLPASGPTDGVEPGQRVDLRSNGLVRQPSTGAAVVGEERPDRPRLSALEFAPVDVRVDLPIEYRAYDLDLSGVPTQTQGSARVVVGERPLWSWLYHRYVAFAL